MIEIEKPRIDTAELTSDGTYGRFVNVFYTHLTLPTKRVVEGVEGGGIIKKRKKGKMRWR